jgi:Iap family predicted aminopeptidase
MISRSILIILTAYFIGFNQSPDILREIVGSAFLENRSYEFLQKICEEAGGRLVGTPENEKALQILADELKTFGYEIKFEHFSMPGWSRGNDEVIVRLPGKRKLNALSLGFVDAVPKITANLVYAEHGFSEDYNSLEVNGKVVLVKSEKPKNKKRLLRQEAIEIAASFGAKAIFFMSERPGELLLASTTNFQGDPARIPAFSITREDGIWLQNLSLNSIPIKIEITVRSYCQVVQTSNVIIKIAGTQKSKVVLGAHFDSWDIGEGAIDNGLGTAILFDVARLLKTFSPANYYSVEIVWFNGEELGLFGSKNYMKTHQDDPIIAMINCDMTGSPTGLNAMGFDEFIPLLEDVAHRLNGLNLNKGVINKPWTNSDHMPFMFSGIPIITLQAHLNNEMLESYHSQPDLFERVDKKYLSEAAAVVTVLIHILANNRDFKYEIRKPRDMVNIFKKFGLDNRLKKQNEWPYGAN